MIHRPSKGNLVNANRAQPVTAQVMRPLSSTPDMWWLASLPHRDSLRLDPDQAAPRTVRRRLAKILPEWSLAQFETVALLVASELVTNSVVATTEVPWTAARPPVRLWVRGAPSVLAILTWDAIPDPPVMRSAGDFDESGRGLAIVESLSARWGYYQARFGGKVTWAVIGSVLPK